MLFCLTVSFSCGPKYWPSCYY